MTFNDYYITRELNEQLRQFPPTTAAQGQDSQTGAQLNQLLQQFQQQAQALVNRIQEPTLKQAWEQFFQQLGGQQQQRTTFQGQTARQASGT
jgi:hypothetical protein